MEQFAEFLSDLKDQFYLCKNITESMFRATERVSGRLRKRLEELCFLLEADAEEASEPEERFPEHLKLMRLFWMQCKSAVQYGSGKNSTESVFVKNLTELRRDVQGECYRRAQAMYLFSGMGVVAGLPVAFLPWIRWFGRATMEELHAFYEGRAGEIVVAVFALITAFCYLLLCLVRRTDKRVYHRPEVLRLLLQRVSILRKAKPCKVCRLEQKGAAYLEAAGLEGNGMHFIIVSGICVGALLGLGLVLTRGSPVLYRVFSFPVAVVLGGGGVTGFYRYLGYLRRLGMQNEVLQLQAMVLLVLDVPNITILKVLDVLGGCGEVFRKKLMNCADAYASEDVQALERLFSEEECTAFRQLAGRFLISERIGLRAAFAELAADRNFFREQLRLDTEQEQKKRAANAQVFVFLPMMFLLFAYLILPFLGCSLEQIKEIFREMGQVGYF